MRLARCLLLAGLLGACTTERNYLVTAELRPGVVAGLYYRGMPVMDCPNCGYVAVGSCKGPDDITRNVTSLGGKGFFYAPMPEFCPGPPYKFSWEREATDRFRARWEIGPVPADMQALSIVLAVRDTDFDRFVGPEQEWYFGACGVWPKKARGKEFLFRDIPRPCRQPGYGPVGLAEARVSFGYAVLSGSHWTIKRDLVAEKGLKSLQFVASPLGVYTSEYQFGPLKKGETAALDERITVMTAADEKGE
jgi:hypothetical protein